jgi:hypothetical protein
LGRTLALAAPGARVASDGLLARTPEKVSGGPPRLITPSCSDPPSCDEGTYRVGRVLTPAALVSITRVNRLPLDSCLRPGGRWVIRERFGGARLPAPRRENTLRFRRSLGCAPLIQPMGRNVTLDLTQPSVPPTLTTAGGHAGRILQVSRSRPHRPGRGRRVSRQRSLCTSPPASPPAGPGVS